LDSSESSVTTWPDVALSLVADEVVEVFPRFSTKYTNRELEVWDHSLTQSLAVLMVYRRFI